MMGVSTVEFILDILKETDEAFLVTDGDHEVWLPKSQIVRADGLEGTGREEAVDFILPEWLAIEKGLV
jgi:hypothetical protein